MFCSRDSGEVWCVWELGVVRLVLVLEKISVFGMDFETCN